jgi:hypothetical protein
MRRQCLEVDLSQRGRAGSGRLGAPLEADRRDIARGRSPIAGVPQRRVRAEVRRVNDAIADLHVDPVVGEVVGAQRRVRAQGAAEVQDRRGTARRHDEHRAEKRQQAGNRPRETAGRSL